MNTFGRWFCVTTFGESHGPAVGAVVDGCPAGVRLSSEMIRRSWTGGRRRGQGALTSARAEPDRVEVLRCVRRRHVGDAHCHDGAQPGCVAAGL